MGLVYKIVVNNTDIVHTGYNKVVALKEFRRYITENSNLLVVMYDDSAVYRKYDPDTASENIYIIV